MPVTPGFLNRLLARHCGASPQQTSKEGIKPISQYKRVSSYVNEVRYLHKKCIVFFLPQTIIRLNFYANIRDIKPTQPTLTFTKEPFTLINRMYLKNRIRNLTSGLIKPSQLFLTFYQLAPETGQIAWCRSRCEKLPIAQDKTKHKLEQKA